MLMFQGAIPGTFFWKPRLGLDLTIPKGGKQHDRHIIIIELNFNNYNYNIGNLEKQTRL